MENSERIGEAWKQHRAGNNDGAVDIFRDILSKHPGEIDALYGLGLAQRAKGDADGAVESFNKAMRLAKDGLDESQNAAGPGIANDLKSDEDDRFLMLQSMISQRLEELDVE